MASVIAGCRDALLTARGEGPSGRLSKACVKISRQRGVVVLGPKILVLRRR